MRFNTCVGGGVATEDGRVVGGRLEVEGAGGWWSPLSTARRHRPLLLLPSQLLLPPLELPPLEGAPGLELLPLTLALLHLLLLTQHFLPPFLLPLAVLLLQRLPHVTLQPTLL